MHIVDNWPHKVAADSPLGDPSHGRHYQLANTWQMNFNIDKCTVMHISHNNIQHNYTMANQQTEKSCKTANWVLQFIARNFNYKSTDLMLPLYKSLVWPHLEYAVQFWSPHLRRDIDKMEWVQRRATKMIPEIRNHSYQQRFKDLKLISLIQRRLPGQLIKVFKYLNRFINVSPIGLFDYDFNDRTQNNGKKLIVKWFNTSVAQHFSPINITTTWNAHPVM